MAGEADLVSVPAVEVANVVDTTGAGDSFAAGFLFGVVRGRRSAGDCARLGALAAAEIVSHLGRPAAAVAGRPGQDGRIAG